VRAFCTVVKSNNRKYREKASATLLSSDQNRICFSICFFCSLVEQFKAERARDYRSVCVTGKWFECVVTCVVTC